MAEQFCTVNDDVTLCYETFGDASDPTMLLVMGLSTQMIGWPDAFCEQLAERGYFVVRFDNRDIGRSTQLKSLGVPTVKQLLLRDKSAARYTLEHMAADGIGLLDHLGIERAHVVGVSMGGMIAQTMAARFPERVLSLASIISNTGSRWSGQPSPRMYPMLLRPAPRDREGFVRHTVETFKKIGSQGFPVDEDELRRTAERSYDRGLNPAGSVRQLAAIIASGDRTPLLRTITVPTLVIHGRKDRLVPTSGGRATAKAIPGARLVIIDGMGHDLPRGAWPRILDEIERNAARAGEPAAAA
jgi:pimeloyl-ACP methyl ester carboxylesterase